MAGARENWRERAAQLAAVMARARAGERWPRDAASPAGRGWEGRGLQVVWASVEVHTSEVFDGVYGSCGAGR